MASGMTSHSQWPENKTLTPIPQADPFVLLRPFLQSWTVGFDQQFEILHKLQKANKSTTYPPYNIKEITEGVKYEIEMAIAGFSKEDVTLTIVDGNLKVEGGSTESKSDTYVHKGIAARTFVQSFVLADYVEVIGATLINGILTISLERKLPEEKKPKTIKIK